MLTLTVVYAFSPLIVIMILFTVKGAMSPVIVNVYTLCNGSVYTNGCYNAYSMYVLFVDKVSCPMTIHYDSGDSQISNPSIPSLTLYELSHCAS